MRGNLIFAGIVSVIAAAVFTSVSVATHRADRFHQAVSDGQTFRVMVYSQATLQVSFEKDWSGNRAERLILEDILNPRVSVTTYLFFYNKDQMGYDVFMERSDEPQNRERIEKLPAYVEAYWHSGQKIAQEREPKLFVENKTE